MPAKRSKPEAARDASQIARVSRGERARGVDRDQALRHRHEWHARPDAEGAANLAAAVKLKMAKGMLES